MNRRGRGRSAVVLAVLAAIFGLSGCFKSNQAVKVRSDGSGTVVLHGEVNKRAIAALTNLGGPNLTATLRPIETTFPDGSKVRSVEDADRAMFDASFSFNGPDDYRRKLRQVIEAVSTNPDLAVIDEGSIAVRRVGDRMEVALDLGTSGLSGFGLSDLAGVLDRDARPEAVVALTMPGSILDTNGTGRGRTATWDLLSPGAPSMLTASSKVGKPALPSWAVPAGVGLVLALLLAIVGVIASAGRRSRRPTGPVVPYRPQSYPPGGQAGPGTFFPTPTGLPPRQPVAWPSPPPSEPSAPPEAPGPGPEPAGRGPTAPSQPSAPPEAPGPGPGPEPAGRGPTAPTTGLPAREPVGTPPDADADAEQPGADPLPWRVPGVEPAPVPDPPAAPATVPEPTAPPVAAAPVAGWYADPAGGPGVRYWDGGSWTNHTH